MGKRKIKFRSYITKDKMDKIIEEKFPNNECPDCHEKGLYGGCVETQYDENSEEYILLSFTVFCSKCGSVITRWDNTYREYLFK